MARTRSSPCLAYAHCAIALLAVLTAALVAAPAARSQEVIIAVTNPLDQPVDQFLRNPEPSGDDDRFIYYYTLQPGDTIDQPSSPGLQWVYSVNGDIRGQYKTGFQPQQSYRIGAVQTEPKAPVMPKEQVSARNLRMADYVFGAFVQVGPLRWQQVLKENWSVIADLEELGRSDQWVQLIDRKRGFQWLLDVKRNQAYQKQPDQDGFNSAIALGEVSTKSLIPGSNRSWDGSAVADGEDGGPLNPFNDPAYTVANRKWTRQEARLGPGENQMTQTLGFGTPIRTDLNEFVTNFREEELIASRWLNQSRGQKLTIENWAKWMAWIDEQGKLHIASQTDKNKIRITNPVNGKREKGPFFRTMNVTVTPSPALNVLQTFPLNQMGSAFVSSSSGFTVTGSVGANVGHPMATGLNANISASYSDTQTHSQQLDTYEVTVRAGPSQGSRVFSWRLCAVGDHRDNANDCYKGPRAIMDRSFLGDVEPDMQDLPPVAFGWDRFTTDVHYVVDDPDTLQYLSRYPLRIDMDFVLVTNRVETSWITQGFRYDIDGTRQTMTYRMTYLLQLSELVNIIYANADRYGVAVNRWN